MGWSIGFDDNHQRDIGYGVIAFCDHPDCNEEIDRGLAYVCANQEPYGGEGCGLYFCGKHLNFGNRKINNCCERCRDGKDPFEAKSDHPFWIRFKMLDPSWATWRKECPDEIKELSGAWDKLSPEVQAEAEKRTKEEMEP